MGHGSCIFLFLNVGLVMVISLGPACFLKTHGVQSQHGGANMVEQTLNDDTAPFTSMSISSTVKLQDHRRPVWSTTISVGRS